ncbi:hypothetical protein BDA99DRAFT_133036 [Phascolomyces articulosus]|uniref:Uncharacterized protein n=1 Tax=Phascolomyces articulosus TaxID=60185 RepID=A0AAD5JVY3_9FUNG|nr:hypothetical protein BDA99DRAFT_133036 [Phascolomyces articulosus]
MMNYLYQSIPAIELRGDPNDVLSSKKKKMCQYLQACGENLKEVVLYENLCPLLISEILTSCPNITRISSTTEESTSRTRLMHHRTQQYKNNSNDRTGRSNKFTDMKRMEYITRSHFTKVYDDYAERGSVIGDNDLKRMNDCKSLVYLEIVGLPIPAFRAPFWQKLRHLQHLILGEPRTPRLLDDVQVKLLHAIDIYCPNLITLRCGYHFKDRAVLPLSPSSSHSNNTNATNKKEKNGLKEITLRTMFYRKNMICKPCLGIESITSMIQRSYHMLQVLHLPIEVFNILVIETISKTIRTLSLLYELGLYTDRTPYYRNNGQGYNDNNVLKPQETRMLIQCCPLLKTIVLKVPTSNGSLLELSKLHQLQRIYFIDSIDEYFFPAVVREQQHLREGRGGDNDEKPTITHADLFFAHCTTLQQVTVRGSFFTDQDLFQLIVNNSELTLLSLHGCDQLTTHGITTALQQLTTTKNRLRSFTFVKLYADINFYEIMVALPNSIASIICVVTVPDDAMQTPHYIHDSLEQVMQTKSNNDDSFCPTVRVLFQNNKVHDNTRPNMLVFHCIPGKGIKEERKDGFEADLLRRRMFADIL